MKTMKTAGIAIIALILSAQLMAQNGAARRAAQASAATEAKSESNGQQLTVPLSDPGKPYKLNVDLTSGSIKVTVYEGRDVMIDVTSPERGKKHADRESSGMRRLSGGDNLDVVAREKNNVVTIGSDIPLTPVMVTIKIPQGATNVKLHTVNDGDIVASNLSGQIEAQNTNGSIELKEVSGSVVANTTNGKVVVTFKSMDNKAPMAFTSFNGNVDVTLPAGTKANVKARSDMNNVFSDFEFASEPSQAKTSKSAKDGMYRLTVEDWITGKIGGGGPEFLFKTFNGNIYIRKAK